ncbi:MAG: tetratricopeptide repeat protein, partial [Longimicrobiales bacterium]
MSLRLMLRLTPCATTLPLLLGGLLPSTAMAQATTAADGRLLESIDYYTGVAGTVDDSRAQLLLLEVAADPDDMLAQMWMARVYSTGRMGFEQDVERARTIASEVIDEIRDLANTGDVEAIFLMGTAYDEALGVANDFPEARLWYGRAAELGHVLAAHNVGNMYRDGRGVEVDHEAAARWWVRAASAGDVIPALRLGEAFEAGRGVEQSLDSARRWYRKAAAAGDPAGAGAPGPPGRP